MTQQTDQPVDAPATNLAANPGGENLPLPSLTAFGRSLRALRNINDEQYVSLFTNLIRVALPYAGTFLRALDNVRAEEAGVTPEDVGEEESDTEIDASGDAPVVSVKSKPKSGKTWYSVTRGSTIGVFNDLVTVNKATSGVPMNDKKSFGTKREALDHFNAAWDAGTCAVIDTGEKDELRMDLSKAPVIHPPPPKPVQVEVVAPVTVRIDEGGASEVGVVVRDRRIIKSDDEIHVPTPEPPNSDDDDYIRDSDCSEETRRFNRERREAREDHRKYVAAQEEARLIEAAGDFYRDQAVQTRTDEAKGAGSSGGASAPKSKYGKFKPAY